MKSKFTADTQDAFGDVDFTPCWDGGNTNLFLTSYFPAAAHESGSPPANSPAPISPPLTPTVPEEAVQVQAAQNGSGGTGSVVAETSGGGITINLVFDAAAMAAPASFRAGIEQAASILSATITNKITVNINIDYSGTGGGAAAGPDNGLFESYSTVRTDLINDAAPGDTTFNALPSGSTIQGQSSVAVWNAQLKLFGLLGANDTTTDDGSATFATDINSSLLVGVALHELTHAMGRVPYGAPYGPQPDIFDLFRFTSAGTRLIAGGNTAPAAYFSVDGGNTKLADFGQTSDPSDFLNRGVQGPNDPFNEFYTSSTSQVLTTIDKELLGALGFNTTTPVTTTIIEAVGSTSLVQVGNNYFLYPVGGSSGPELKYGGTPITSPGTWTPIGAEPTAGGYEVAWKMNGADQYAVWNADSNGNYVSNAVLPTSGGSSALELIETSFHQDLNGDGVIGPVSTVIAAVGSTSLVQVGNNYFLYPVGGSSGPELKYGGTPITSPGTWTPIGAESTAGGYEVAWKMNGADQYAVWNADSNGNYVSNAVLPTSGASSALESTETSFHQDLNGDGVIGPVSTIIEAVGSTSLVQLGNNYFLYPVGGSSGPELKYGGTPITSPGTWTPIGAEPTAGGYEVAWKMNGADQYAVWNADSNGNYVSNAVLPTSGGSSALELIETSFHQDLNGDGVIGPVSTVIAAVGSTSLVQVGNNYFLYPVGGSSGPELRYGGTPITSPGTWTPIGAKSTAGGYEVAWKMNGADQYAVWNADSNGNYVSNAVLPTSGASSALESIETSFHQDLNGDGVIGVPAATGPVATGSLPQVAAVTVANNDTFIFPSSGNAGDGAGAVPHHDAFPLDVASKFAAFFHDAHAEFRWANDISADAGNHDGMTATNAHIAELEAAFLLH